MEQPYVGSVFLVAGHNVLFFRTTERVLSDALQMDREEALSAAFYDLDGEVLELSYGTDTAQLTRSGRRDLPALQAALEALSHGEGATDPRVVANEILDSEWRGRWPKGPRMLHRLLHGESPPTI
jgi:hypothetical protein